jgi:hypothetical protein
MSLKNPNVVNPKSKKRVAIVISNPAISSTTGWPAGFWWSELTHPYYAFNEKGYEVEVFSPSGGTCEPHGMSDPRDPSGYSSSDLVSMGFIHSPKLVALVENTKKVSTIDVRNFDAILVAGGLGPMFTYEKAVDLHKKFVEFYEAGRSHAFFAMEFLSWPSRNSAMGNISPKEKPSPASRTSRRSSPTTPYGA